MDLYFKIKTKFISILFFNPEIAIANARIVDPTSKKKASNDLIDKVDILLETTNYFCKCHKK